jgi:hypothetical protein
VLGKLNLEEIFVGACIQFPFYFLIGWWVLPLMLVSGILWALGGAEKSNKLFRRLGVAVATSVAVVLTNLHWWPVLLFIPAGWGVITLGYGMPSNDDEGSVLGRFYLALLPYKLANMATRLTTYVLYWVAFILTGKALGVLGLIPII